MNITTEQIKELKESYLSNKKDLKAIRDFILEHGCTNDGLIDETESFEQGWNNAMEYVFYVLGI